MLWKAADSRFLCLWCHSQLSEGQLMFLSYRGHATQRLQIDALIACFCPAKMQWVGQHKISTWAYYCYLGGNRGKQESPILVLDIRGKVYVHKISQTKWVHYFLFFFNHWGNISQQRNQMSYKESFINKYYLDLKLDWGLTYKASLGFCGDSRRVFP